MDSVWLIKKAVEHLPELRRMVLNYFVTHCLWMEFSSIQNITQL